MPIEISEETKLYLSGLENASKRSRWVFYLLLASTCLIFAYNWKLQGPNWLEGRVEWRKNILEVMDRYEVLYGKEELSKKNLRPEEEKKLFADRFGKLADEMGYGDYKNSYLESARAFKLDLAFKTQRDILKSQMENLEGESRDLFKLPFFTDANFDINDFVLFSSVQLFILGFVLIYCLLREQDNLSLLLGHVEKMEESARNSLWQIAGLGQLFTIPGKMNFFKWFGVILLVLLMFFPVGVLWWIFGWDMASSISDTAGTHWWKIFYFWNWNNLLIHSDSHFLEGQISLYHSKDPGYQGLAFFEFCCKIIFVLLFTLEMTLAWYLYVTQYLIWNSKGSKTSLFEFSKEWLKKKP